MARSAASLPELKAEIDRLDTKDALIVVYLDVGDLPPTVAVDYIQRVKKEMGNLPSPMFWIPCRGDQKTRVVAMKPDDVRAIYIDVGDLPSTQAKEYVDVVRRTTKLLPKVPFIASRDGIPAMKLVDEKEMNEHGWYYYGVRPDGSKVGDG